MARDRAASLKENLVQLARLSLSGETKQVEAYVRRLGRTLLKEDPQTANALISLAGSGAVLRRQSTDSRSGGAPYVPIDQESRLDLLRIDNAPHIGPDPILDSRIADQIDQLINERVRADELISAGLEPSSTILFTGAPGVGKTFTAHWIAQRLNKPLFTLDLASVMSSLLGKTGNNLKAVLEFAKRSDGVLLLDEFDAVAKRRDDDTEVGELKRLVTVILQEIDNWPTDKLLIAATNHGDLLDPAVWRRFDAVIEFPLPHQAILQELLDQELGDNVPTSWSRAMAVMFAGRSFSDVSRSMRSIRKRALITGEPVVEGLNNLIASEVDRLSKHQLKALGVELEAAGVPQRQVSELTGLSRDTIRKARLMEHPDG